MVTTDTLHTDTPPHAHTSHFTHTLISTHSQNTFTGATFLFPGAGVIPALLVVMNVNRGGAFNDESFGNARARAVRVFQEVFGAESDEFLEYADHLPRDFNLTSRPSNTKLHKMFLECAAHAIRPQDKA